MNAPQDVPKRRFCGVHLKAGEVPVIIRRLVWADGDSARSAVCKSFRW